MLANNILLDYNKSFQGHPRLVKVLAKLYSSLIGQKIDPYTEVLISIGAYEALYCSIMGLVDVGDEVIIIEPFFDCYDTMVRYAGGISKFIPLRNVSLFINNIQFFSINVYLTDVN